MNIEYKHQMNEIHDFIVDLTKRLSRPIQDLDDIREGMQSLELMKSNFTKFDFALGLLNNLFNRVFFLSMKNTICFVQKFKFF